MGPSVSEILLLGVLQGATEFLPVSSSGHLALGQMLFGVEDASLTVNVMMHAGTLVATAIMLRHRLAEILIALADGLRRPKSLLESTAGRDAIFVVVASLPTAAIGLLARDIVSRWTASPLVVAIGFFLTAGLLIASRWAYGGTDTTPSAGAALILGVVQGIAIVPGVSRSGSTIAAALWLGVRADRAFELSMLMSLPAVFGAVLLEGRHAFEHPEGIGVLLLGAAVAFGVGLLALGWLRHSVVRGYFSWFALWVLPVAFATLALAWAWPARI